MTEAYALEYYRYIRARRTAIKTARLKKECVDLSPKFYGVHETEPTVKELKAISLRDYAKDWFRPVMEYIDYCYERDRLQLSWRVLEPEVIEIENFRDLDQYLDQELCEQYITDNLRSVPTCLKN